MRATEVHKADLDLNRVIAVFAYGERPNCVGRDGVGKDTEFRTANFAKLVGRAVVLLRAGDRADQVAMLIKESCAFRSASTSRPWAAASV